MPTNLAKFNTELLVAEKKIHGDFEKFYKQVITEVLKRIVLRTPVKTGRARGNWQIEFGGPASGILDVTGSKSAMASLAISSGVQKLEDILPFSLVHITNNVEYISYLEYDKRSEQHPEGFLEITLTEMAIWLAGI